MAGYSGTPLQKKLGIKPGFTCWIISPPESYFDWISPLPGEVSVLSKPRQGIDFVHLFVKKNSAFQKAFTEAKGTLKKDGMIWISWPKKTSGVQSDLDENSIREFGLKKGMVDVKVCAVDETWSGLKFVFRMKDRK